jgi:hypothetical protein
MYFDENVGGIFNTTNSDKNMVYESVYSSMYAMSLISMSLLASAGLNMVCKGIKASGIQTTGQLSVYGNSFSDIFLGDFTGRLTLAFNEPTAETVNQFTMVSGTAKFNSSGGILMGIIGDQAIFEDSCFRLGHTGFVNTAPIMSGGTIGNYTLEYQMDIGEGYSGS